MISDVKDILENALNILDDESHWTKRSSARDADDRPVDVISEEAVSFCLIGAISRAIYYSSGIPLYETAHYQVWDVILNAVRSKYPDHGVSSFNDDPSTTLQDVHSILKVALASTEIGYHAHL